MQPHIERARVLISQDRYELAEAELHHALAADPDDGLVHAMLAICFLCRKHRDAATHHAQVAVGKAPDDSFTHYVLALVWFDRNDPPRARTAIEQAIALDPADDKLHVHLGDIEYADECWSAALAAAETALKLDPDNHIAINLRAKALRQLARPADALAQLRSAVARRPDNDATHANLGWQYLQNGDRAQARTHFREALRLNPQNESAREGLIDTIKAGNPAYRVILDFFFWMGRKSRGGQWRVLVGIWLLYVSGYALAKIFPALGTFLWPVLGLYLAFVAGTWFAVPLGNLALRLHPVGRLALTRRELGGALLVGGLLLVGLTMLAGMWIAPPGSWPVIYGSAAFYFIGAAVPASFWSQFDDERKRRVAGWYTLCLSIVGLPVLVYLPVALYIIVAFPDSPLWNLVLLLWMCGATTAAAVFALGVGLSAWGNNWLNTMRWRR